MEVLNLHKASIPPAAIDEVALREPLKWQAVIDTLESAYASGYSLARDVGDTDAYRLANTRAGDWAARRSGELIKDIEEDTRSRVRSAVSKAYGGDVTNDQLIREIRESGAFSEGRARMIARTEVGFASNAGQVAGYGDGGAMRVVVSDGVDSDAECAAADGQTWTLAFAEANLLQHPNCTRSFGPIIEEAGLTGEAEQVVEPAPAREFDDPKEVSRWATKWQGRTADLSDDQKKRLRSYTGNQYREVNDLLRHGVIRGIGGDIPVSVEGKAKWRSVIGHIDSAMAPIPEDVIATRTISARSLGVDIQKWVEPTLDDLKGITGKIMRDDGYMSTALVGRFGGGMSGRVTMRLRVQAGHKARYVEPITANKGEYELLLERGTAIRIDRVERVTEQISGGNPSLGIPPLSKDRIFVHATVVPGESGAAAF